MIRLHAKQAMITSVREREMPSSMMGQGNRKQVRQFGTPSPELRRPFS